MRHALGSANRKPAGASDEKVEEMLISLDARVSPLFTSLGMQGAHRPIKVKHALNFLADSLSSAIVRQQTREQRRLCALETILARTYTEQAHAQVQAHAHERESERARVVSEGVSEGVSE